MQMSSSALKIPFAFKQDPILTVLYVTFGENAPGELKKKILIFALAYSFNVLISVPSQLTPHLSHLKALVKVQGFYQPPSVITSKRFIHVKAPACKLLFRIALGSFLLHFAK